MRERVGIAAFDTWGMPGYFPRVSLDNQLSRWSNVATIVTFVCAAVVLVVGWVGFLAMRRRYRVRKASRALRVRTVEDQRPLRVNVTGRLIGMPTFVHLKVRNDPAVPTADHLVRVSAEITYIDEHGTELLTVPGRWGDTDQPIDYHGVRSTVELETVEIPIGRERELNLAMKYPEDEHAYAFSNTTYQAPDGGGGRIGWTAGAASCGCGCAGSGSTCNRTTG